MSCRPDLLRSLCVAALLTAVACGSDVQESSPGHATAGVGAERGDSDPFGNAGPSAAGADGSRGSGVARPTAGESGGRAGSGSSGDDPLTTDNACGMGSASAALTPVNMLVMFDRSASMDDNNKWPNATAALISFFQNPGSAGLGVAFRFFPDRDPGCNRDGCDPMACSNTLVDIDKLTADPAPADAQEQRLVSAITNAGQRGGGGTPIHAALDGALRWAIAHQMASPDETTVVVFVTDGEPNGCDEDFDHISALAADALASAGVRTYAIGLEGSSEAQMNQLAMAGGTRNGIFIGNSANAEEELLAALDAIRGETLTCDFPMPQPDDPGMTFDPAKINVTFTPGNGEAATFANVADEGACGGSSGWFYDDAGAPTRITLCPRACDTVRGDPDARLEILIGCATCGGLDVDCGDGAPPGVPPVIID